MIGFAAQLLVVANALAPAAHPPSTYPFAVGERAVYDVSYFGIHAGTGTMEVAGIDTVRGGIAYRLVLTITGGVPLVYRIHDTLRSWIDTAVLRSVRYYQDQDEGGRNRVKRYEIFPDRRVYSEPGKPEQPSVEGPLDDVSFLYFARTLALTVGDTLSYARYFKPESNPVQLIVLRTERVRVPAGEFSTIVVQPIIKTSGIFSQGGHAEVYLSDDSVKRVVQLKTKVAFAQLTLQLKSFQPAGRPPGNR